MKTKDLIFGLMASQIKNQHTVSELIYLTKPFGVSESNLRTNLSRMSAQGLLEGERVGRSVTYRFTPKAREISANVARGFRSVDWNGWDESWWGILFSIPELQKKFRYRIRKKLTAYRFVPLQAGFWVRPFHKDERMEFHLKGVESHPNCRMIKFQSRFGISEEEVSQLWKLDQVNREFGKALGLINKSLTKIPNLTPEQAFVEGMNMSAIIVGTLFQDPLLPDVYLPNDWKGKELKQQFKSYNRTVQYHSKPFWNQIAE